MLKWEPDLSRIPFEVRRLLNDCLDKDPRRRLRDIGDAWRLLDQTAPLTARRSRMARILLWTVASLLAIALIIAALRRPANETPRRIQVSLLPP